MKSYSFIVALAGLASAMPFVPAHGHSKATDSSTTAFDGSTALGSLTEQQVVAAAPKSASCASPIFSAEECSTATTATPLLNAAFEKYGQTSLGQIAALVSLMAFESADFQANINHFPAPGRPGQGTKALLMFNFVYEYAFAQPEFTDQVTQLSGGSKLTLTFDTISTVAEETQKEIRALVLPDEYTFGAASWFLSTQCDASVAEGLSTGGFAGFKTYMETCVQVGTIAAGDERSVSWCKTINALKPASMPAPAECS